MLTNVLALIALVVSVVLVVMSGAWTDPVIWALWAIAVGPAWGWLINR